MEPEIEADFKRMYAKAFKEGYKEGAHSARESALQKSFDIAFETGFKIAYHIGQNHGMKIAIERHIPRNLLPTHIKFPEENKSFMHIVEDVITNKISVSEDVINQYKDENRELLEVITTFNDTNKCER